MLLVATMAAVFSHRLNAEMQIGLTSNYAYSERGVKIDGRDGHYVELEGYVSHIHVGYDVVPWVFEYGVDQRLKGPCGKTALEYARYLEDNHFDIEFLNFQSTEFLNIHLETAVSVNIDDESIRTCGFGSHSGRKSETHCTESA